jgi:hypothetical protein
MTWVVALVGLVGPLLGARFRRVGGDLPLPIVAEDWCPDSVHTVPYVAALAAQAGVEWSARLCSRLHPQNERGERR